ncbi:MAG: hypothetical protein A4E19_18010 [Nitrospira sp. SG-bin1]|nr:MAG: hypothetical protein A4E19_18010 [Nitrospira sp. SG-bin1]
MHIAENQPRLNPETNGRARRFVTRTQIVRPVRLDAKSDRALEFIRRELKDPSNFQDLCSVSMAVRRALRLYSAHVDRLRLDPATLALERQAVRECSQLPGRRRKPKVAVPTGNA